MQKQAAFGRLFSARKATTLTSCDRMPAFRDNKN